MILAGLHIVMDTLCGIYQSKMHAHGFGRVVWPQTKGIIAQIFAGFDVVLVVVGPIEFDLFTVVGDSISAVA